MPEYYFDIETYSPGEKPDPDSDKIITFQYQRMDIRTGKPIGQLIILKEWESSEETIVKTIHNQFFNPELSPWNFIPIGFGLHYEWEFLISKFNKYLQRKITSRELHYSRPHIDMKSVLVLLNGGSFKGASLENFSNKPMGENKKIKEYYEQKNYDAIVKYIENEAGSAMEFMQAFLSYIQNAKSSLQRKFHDSI